MKSFKVGDYLKANTKLHLGMDTIFIIQIIAQHEVNYYVRTVHSNNTFDEIGQEGRFSRDIIHQCFDLFKYVPKTLPNDLWYSLNEI